MAMRVGVVMKVVKSAISTSIANVSSLRTCKVYQRLDLTIDINFFFLNRHNSSWFEVYYMIYPHLLSMILRLIYNN